MSTSNPVQEKSYAFALKIIGLYKEMVRKKEFTLSRQLLKSGTSIGANIEEALQGQSRKDFISKLSISLKETCETKYWLRLLRDSRLLPETSCKIALDDVEELKRLLTAILKTTKKE